MGLILLLILGIFLIGALPLWSHARGWGYGPSILLAIVVVVLVAMVFLGVLPFL